MKHTTIAFKAMFATVLLGGLFIAGCGDDDTTTEQENITTVVLHFTGPGLDAEFEWNDLDGPGGNTPEIDTIALPPLNANVNCHVHVYDRSKNPATDITDEIEAEANNHLFVYQPDTSLVVVWTYVDTDSNGKPLGIETLWTTGQPATGNLRVILYHEPANKDDQSNPGGEVDLDVTFPVKIQ